MKKAIILIAVLLMFALTSCNVSLPKDVLGNNGNIFAPGMEPPGNNIENPDNENITEAGTPALSEEATGFEIVEIPESDFKIVPLSEGTIEYDRETNTYNIKCAGEYDCFGSLNEGQLRVVAGEEDEVVINLNNCMLSNSSESPIYIESAGKVEISANADSINMIYDLRSSELEYDDTAGSAAIYAQCDLTLKGKGVLEIISQYNNGVHTKDDLKIKNLALNVKAVNNALKGNDSISIESGELLIVSTGGDALKTTSTDLSKNGELRGAVNIKGGSLKLYSACDGIDAATDVNISGEAIIDIYTDVYSPYSGSITEDGEQMIYIRLTQSINSLGYSYSAYLYNDDGSYTWADVTLYKTVTPAFTRPGGRFGGPGGKPGGFPPGGDNETYYYYSFENPVKYSNVKIYAYNNTMTPGQSVSYVAVSDGTEINAVLDTYVVSNVSGEKIYSSGWTSYEASIGNSGRDYSCKGIKAGNIIEISGGQLNILSPDDGIHSDFDEVIEASGSTGLGFLKISGGIIVINSDDDGIHADGDVMISGGHVNIGNSYEGIEGNRVYISDGLVNVYARNDGLNANNKGKNTPLVEISGGVLDISVGSGDTDTIDSNGTVSISGGMIYIKNASTNGGMMGGTLDTDRGVTVSGGSVISIGTIGNTISGSKYNSSLTLNAGSYSVKTQSGEPLFDFSLDSSYRGFMIFSDMFERSETYILYRGEEVITSFEW